MTDPGGGHESATNRPDRPSMALRHRASLTHLLTSTEFLAGVAAMRPGSSFQSGPA